MKASRATINSPAWKAAVANGTAVYRGRECHRSKEKLCHVESPYANHFKVGGTYENIQTGQQIVCETTEQAIAMFAFNLVNNPELLARARRELPGKVLGCFCKMGKPCHVDVIVETVNGGK